MRFCRNTRIITGHPGTGKTTRLLGMVQDVLQEGVPPGQIGYVSFTRAAVNEARDRAMKVTGCEDDVLVGFRTIHSLVYWLHGIRKEDLMDDHDYTAINVDEGLGITEAQQEFFRHITSYCQLTGSDYERAWEEHTTGRQGNPAEFYCWLQAFQDYKERTGKMDFNDMLQRAVDRGMDFSFSHLFVDEAQDLSPLQWQVIQLLAEQSEYLVIAGDSNQSVYQWAGADTVILDALEGERENLSQSYRIPRKVHLLASRVLELMGKDVVYRPRPEDGCFEWASDTGPYMATLEGRGTWYFLARTNYALNPIKDYLRGNKVPYDELGAKKENSRDKYIQDSIIKYESIVAACSKIPETEDYRLPAVFEKALSKFSTAPEYYVRSQAPWQRAFDLLSLDDIDYYTCTRPQWGKTVVKVGTFHASKGGEADNVVLLGNCTRMIEDLLKGKDSAEMRALYVAITRAKKNLVICDTSSKNGIPWHMLFRIPEDLNNGLL